MAMPDEEYGYYTNARKTYFTPVYSLDELRAECPWRSVPNDYDAIVRALMTADCEEDFIDTFIEACKTDMCDYGSHPHTHTYTDSGVEGLKEDARRFIWNYAQGDRWYIDTCLLLEQDGALIRRMKAADVMALRAKGSADDEWLRDGGGCYMLYNPLTGLVKIGRSGNNLLSRWHTLETQGGAQLHPLVFWSHPNPKRLEGELHTQFARSRVIGEWFSSAGVCDWVQQKHRDAQLEDFHRRIYTVSA